MRQAAKKLSESRSRQGDWELVPLGSLAEFRNGVNFTKESFGRGIKVINVKDFQDRFRPDFGDLGEINPEGVIRDADLLHEGDIVFVRSNGNRQLIGRSLFISKAAGAVTHSAFTIRARFSGTDVFPLFYAYLLRSHSVRQALSAHGGGTNINNLNQTILASLPVLKPPLDVQLRIASSLSAYDELVENNTQRIKMLEDIAQTLFREWFVHFHFPAHPSAPLAEASTRREGWEVKKAKDIILRLKAGKVYKGSEVSEAGTIPVIDQSRDEILGFHENQPDHIAEPGRPVIIFGDHTCKMQMMVEPFSVGPNVVPFVSRDDIPTPYLFFLVRNLVETSEYKRHWGELTNKEVMVAPAELARKFALLVTPIFEQIDSLRRKNSILRRTRDLLLPRLVSGEIVM